MEILHQNSDFVICIKPVGLDSETAVPQALVRLLGGECYPVHRLDQNVAGVMVYARTRTSAAKLSSLISAGHMQKEYVALVHGLPPEAGDWTDLLWKDSRRNKAFVVQRQRAGVKEARLEFRQLAQWGDTTLVRVHLHTGRSHQIRVQFASRGFPLVGDHKYGARDSSPAPMLFSCYLSFPWHGKQMTFQSVPEWAGQTGT